MKVLALIQFPFFQSIPTILLISESKAHSIQFSRKSMIKFPKQVVENFKYNKNTPKFFQIRNNEESQKGMIMYLGYIWASTNLIHKLIEYHVDYMNKPFFELSIFLNSKSKRNEKWTVFAHACWYVNIRWFLEIRNNSLYWKYSFLNTRECFWNRYSTECLFLILIFKWFILISNNSSIQSGTPINIFIYIIVW